MSLRPNIKKLFIICPIGQPESLERIRSDKVKRNIIDPVAQEKYVIYRSDEISKPGNISYEIIDHLLQDELVVADITDHNSNVLYELAVRHATQEPVILIGEAGWNPPFDISQQRVINYNLTDPDSVREAKLNLQEQIISVESGEFIIDSPIKQRILIERALKESSESPELEAILNILNSNKVKLNTIVNLLSTTIPEQSASQVKTGIRLPTKEFVDELEFYKMQGFSTLPASLDSTMLVHANWITKDKLRIKAENTRQLQGQDIIYYSISDGVIWINIFEPDEQERYVYFWSMRKARP